MDIEKLFNILNAYQGFTLTLWNFYIAVVLGLLGYAIGSKKAEDWSIRIILVLAFCVFAWGNFQFIERNQFLINALSKEIAIKAKAEASNALSGAISDWSDMQPSSPGSLHFWIDAGVVLLLLFGPSIAKSIRPKGSDDQIKNGT